MKIEHVKTWKLAGKVAVVMAVGALASAQSARGNGTGEVRKGQVLKPVSMENDIHSPEPAHGMIILERPDRQQERALELILKMRPRANADLRALVPSMEDMETTLLLVNGTPGGVAVIHLDTQAPELRRASGVRIVGLFDENGRFSAVLPEGFQARGIFAHGEEMTLVNGHLAPGGGRAVPASKRPVMEDMDVEQVAATTYFNWVRYYVDNYTNLQFKSGGLRSASLDAGRSAGAASTMALSSGGLALGGGHTLPGSGVEDDADVGQEQVSGDLPNPVGGKRAFGKIQLQRPQVPAQQDGHVLQRKL